LKKLKDNEKRMAGDYEIIQSMLVGDKEVILGEDRTHESGKKYICSFCQHSDLFSVHQDIIASDDYLEIVKIFGERIAEQAEKARLERSAAQKQGISNAPISAADCIPISPADDLDGKIIVIKAEVLRREYQSAIHQLKLCTGGFGSQPNSRGTAVFCTDLYSGREGRFERWDVLGTMEPEMLPDWAKQRLSDIQREPHKQKDREAR